MTFVRGTLGIAAALAFPFLSYASPIYQSVPDLVNATPSYAYCSSCSGNYQVYDTFSISSATSIQGISVSLATYTGAPTSFDVEIFGVLADGAPGPLIWSQPFSANQFVSVQTGKPGYLSNTSSAIYSVDPTSLTLLAGTYDISFYNATNLGVEAFSESDGLLYQINGAVGYSLGDYSSGFVLSDTPFTPVPEPGTFALFVVGSACVAFLRSRARHRVASSPLIGPDQDR